MTRIRRFASIAIVTKRSSPVASGSAIVTACGSSKDVAASAKSMLCRRRLLLAFSASQLKYRLVYVCTDVHRRLYTPGNRPRRAVRRRNAVSERFMLAELLLGNKQFATPQISRCLWKHWRRYQVGTESSPIQDIKSQVSNLARPNCLFCDRVCGFAGPDFRYARFRTESRGHVLANQLRTYRPRKRSTEEY